MTYPIIKTDNYILITSDELAEKNYGYSPNSNEIFYYTKNIYGKGHESWVNIIAHLPLNNQPILEGVPLLPPLPNEDIDLAAQEYPFLFIEGYKKAKEKYKFTEEDVRFIILKSFLLGVDRGQYSKELEDRLVSSLSQPKLPVGFKCEMEEIAIGGFIEGVDEAVTVDKKIEPKIINGVMQGEWIFE